MTTAPSTIFKYESFMLRAIQNLKRQSIYFGSPNVFNDPYDCAITASIADPTPDQVETVKQSYLTASDTSDALKKLLTTLPPDQLKEQLVRGAQMAVNDAREKFMFTNGVTCFTEFNDNLLLWSHYGGQYRGFCLEFRTEYEPFNKLRKVRYTDTMPKIDIVDCVTNHNYEQLLDLFCTKSSSWAYEQEWRAMHADAGTLFSYKPEALKAIYFGPECPEQDCDLICCIMHTQNPDVELYRGRRSTTEFKVEFSSVSYRPPAHA